MLNMGKEAICFYSATGNGYSIAKELNKYISADMFYIPSIIGMDLSEYEKIIIVSPVYMFALPNIMKTFIKNLTNYKVSPKIYVVFNSAGIFADVAYYTQRMFNEKNIKISAVYKICMPLTYTWFLGEMQAVVDSLLRTYPKKVKKIAEKIIANEEKPIKRSKVRFLTKIHENLYKTWGVFAKSFYTVESNCNQCGYCEKICPAGNIRIVDGKIEFGDQCISCLACYHRCPEKAINVGTHTTKRKRYVNPCVNVDEMYKCCSVNDIEKGI